MLLDGLAASIGGDRIKSQLRALLRSLVFLNPFAEFVPLT